MKQFLKKLREDLTEDEISKVCGQLNKSYYAYMLESQVWDLLYSTFSESLNPYLDRLHNDMLGHDVINELIMALYPCERLVKYHLVKKSIKRSKEVTIFEMNVGNSRLDIGKINGSSFVYEIKTELDSLNKLEKQINDYSKVFEYINIVIHPKHLKKTMEIIPEYCGVKTYNITYRGCKFTDVIEAKKNPLISASTQIQTLTSKDLEYIITKFIKAPVPQKRTDRSKIILERYADDRINYFFKEAVKNRYSNRWSFVCQYFNDINPIDIQEFYKGPIDLSLIYSKNS